MKTLILLSTFVVATAMAHPAYAQRACAGGSSGTTSTTGLTSTTATLAPITATSSSALLATPLAEQAYLRRLAYQQQVQQAYLQQQYLQMQYMQQELAQVKQEQERYDRKIAVRRERRLAEEARRNRAHDDSPYRHTTEPRLAAKQ